MTARRVERLPLRASGLPVLLSLLFVVLFGAGVEGTPGTPGTVAPGSPALSSAGTPAHPATAATRTDIRLLAKRGAQLLPGPLFAGHPPVYRLIAPAGWQVRTSVATGWFPAVPAEVYQGRAPPFAA
ncbi:MAG TPA: hypothetical protein VK453_07780 [Micromonosporaceae bacterium]|nr:hypothetical protein [Micromonosporaceae bacterium]